MKTKTKKFQMRLTPSEISTLYRLAEREGVSSSLLTEVADERPYELIGCLPCPENALAVDADGLPLPRDRDPRTCR